MVPNRQLIEGSKNCNRKEYGKRFSNVQSKQLTGKEKSTCRKYPSTHQQSTTKKGQSNWIRWIQENIGHKDSCCNRTKWSSNFDCVQSPANEHDSTKFIDVMENISEFLDDDTRQETVTVYADKGYDAAYIRNYCRCNGTNCCIPYKKNSRFIVPENQQNIYNKTRFVVERFFAWLKCGFGRTAIRYERNCDNYLGLVYLASIMMYWRVLG